MAFPTLIEVQSGSDQRLLAGLWLVWLGALVATLVHAQRMPVILLASCGVLLLWSVPRTASPSLKYHRLKLQADGRVSSGEWHGQWHPSTWRSRWFTVIGIRTDQSRWWAWISARNNSAEDYRRLGIWCRYPQQQTGKATDPGQKP